MTDRQLTSPIWFAAPLVGAYIAAFFVVRTLPRLDDPSAVAVALTLDLVVLVPLLYFMVLVRGRGWPAVTVVPVFLMSFGAASLMVPDDYHTLLNAFGYVLPVVEVGLVGYIGYRAICIVRSRRRSESSPADFYDRIRETMQGAFDVPAVVGVLAYEISLFHYAFSVRRKIPPAHGFTYHRRGGYGAVFAAILMVAAVELVAVHFLLQVWSSTAVLIHAGLSLYGITWLVGDYRAMRRRPHELLSTGIKVRCGLRWDLEASWDQVERIRRTRQPVADEDYLGTVPIGHPEYVIELGEPVTAIGPYGVTRDVRLIGLAVDEPPAFEERLEMLGVQVQH